MYCLLIVDDEAVERKGIEYLLGEMGFQLDMHLAEDGEAAWQLIESGLRPDVVMTDIRMPFMDGLTLAEKVHGRLPDVQIIIYSAYDEFEYARRALKTGARDYLLKPVDPRELYELFEEILKRLETGAGAPQKPHSTEDRAEEQKERFLVRQIRGIIDAHYGEELGVEEIAARVARSPNHVSRVFCAETGEPLMKYLIRYRMEKAAELLKTTNIKAAEVAKMVGYISPTYFGQVFRKAYGMTPNAYRERYGQ